MGKKEKAINGTLTPSEFASRIKEKYPAYKDLEDNFLVERFLEKYPVYKDQVDFQAAAPKKKEEKEEREPEATPSILQPPTTDTKLDTRPVSPDQEPLEPSDGQRPLKEWEKRVLAEAKEADQELAASYDKFKAAGKLRPDQLESIDEKIENQKKGELGYWETVKAYARGAFNVGVPVPVLNVASREELTRTKERKNQIDYIEDLPEKDKAALQTFVEQKAHVINAENLNILAQTKAMENKAMSLYDELNEMAIQYKEIVAAGNTVDPEFAKMYMDKKTEHDNISDNVNKNYSILENDDSDIGTLEQEIDLLRRNYGAWDNFKGRILATTDNIITGVEQKLNELQFGLTNPLVTTPAGLASPFRAPLSDIEGVKDRYEKRTAENLRKYEQTQLDLEKLAPNITVDDISNAGDLGQWMAQTVANQLPIIAAMAVPGIGQGSVLLSAAGDKELGMRLDMQRGGVKYTDNEVFLASYLFGGLEWAGERFGTLPILAQGRRAFLAALKGRQKNLVNSGIEQWIKGTLREGASEAATQFFQNTVDKFYLGKDVSLLDNVTEAALQGAFMGNVMSGSPVVAGSVARLGAKRADLKKAKANLLEADRLAQGLDSDNLSPETKKMLVKQLSKKLQENARMMNKSMDVLEQVSVIDANALARIDKQTTTLENAFEEVKRDPNMDINAKIEFAENLKKQYDRLDTQREEIIDRYAKEARKVRKEAKAEEVRAEPVGRVREDDRPETAPPEVTQPEVTPTEQVVEPTKVEEDEKVQLPRTEEDITEPQAPTEPGVLEDAPGDQRAEPIEEAREVEAPTTIEDFQKVDLAESLGIKKADEFLSGIKEELDAFGKETLGVNIPVSLAKGAVTVMQGAVKTAKTTADVISAGINHIKASRWYKNLSPEDQAKVEADFLKSIGRLAGEAKEKRKAPEKKPEAPKKVDVKTELKKIIRGVPVISYLDEKWEKGVVKNAEDWIAKTVSRSLQEGNKYKRFLAQSATNWFNGLPRTDKQLREKRKLKGQQNLSFVEGSKRAFALQTLINFSEASAERVHAAMDPEVYAKDEQVSFEELSPNEKELFKQLRKLNDRIHDVNFREGFIDKKTYEKFKGKYIGRGYEVYEKTLDDIEKKDFAKTSILDKIYKARKDVDQWKIDNKVKDPIYLTINRMLQTERNVAVKTYADYITQQKGLVKKSDKPIPGYTKLEGRAYGALGKKNVYVVNYIAEDFKGYFYSNAIMDKFYDAVSAYDRTAVRQFLKRYHTVYNIQVQAGNFLSNNAFAFVSGVNPIQLYSNMPAALKDIRDKTGDYLILVKEGIIGEDILTKDLTLRKNIPEELRISKKKRGVIQRNLNRLDEKAKKFYSGSDDINKLAAYKALRNGGFTEAEAVQRVFEGFQNYSTVGKIWDVASKTPVIGNAYIKFQADLIRIMKNAVTKRPLTTASFAASLKLMAYIGSRLLSGETPEEQRIREARPFIPKMNLGVMDVPLVFKIGSKELNIARYISPYYEYDVPNQDWVSKMTRFTPFQIKSVEAREMGQKQREIQTPDVLLGALYAAIFRNRDFRNKSISDPYATRYKESGLTTREKILNKIGYVGRSVVPLWSLGQDIYYQQVYDEDYFGRDKDLMDILVSKIAKVETFDDKTLQKTIIRQIESIEYREKAINNKIKNIKRRLDKENDRLSERVEAGTLTEKRFIELMQKEEKRTEARIENQLEKLVKVQEEMNKLVSDINEIPQVKLE